ncbi:MAG: hypothetical protein LBN07_03735 [Christensenellaceae bacterium]|jgi:TM2 domain-containing membrane protein YozV|nr:hypothetical protein [Christensenellaceae bacterium]
MAKSASTYLGTGWIVSLILSIFFGWIFAFIHRLLTGHIISAILALPFLFGFIFWIVDLVSLIATKKISWLLF